MTTALKQEAQRLISVRAQLLDTWDAENRDPTNAEMMRCDEIKARLAQIAPRRRKCCDSSGRRAARESAGRGDPSDRRDLPEL